jgi:hypothetical protein
MPKVSAMTGYTPPPLLNGLCEMACIESKESAKGNGFNLALQITNGPEDQIDVWDGLTVYQYVSIDVEGGKEKWMNDRRKKELHNVCEAFGLDPADFEYEDFVGGKVQGKVVQYEDKDGDIKSTVKRFIVKE